MRRRSKILVFAGLAVLGIGIFLAYPKLRGLAGGGASETAAAAPAPGVPVMVATAKAEDVPIILRGLGSVQAFNTVDVRSRVEGTITQVNFKEGQEVKTGDLLFQIDPRPFQTALDQATAALARDQANLGNAQADLNRYSALLKQNFAPEQQYATQKATVAQDEAATRSDQAMIDAAKLNIDYAAIRSPIDGRTGIRQVDIGNLIEANSTRTLVVVTQLKPIYVVFPIAETDLPQIRAAMAKGKLAVEAYEASDTRQIASGVLDLVDNEVDAATGTVKLKAEFPNADEALWPGEFVNAHLVVETVKNGVTVPAAAVQDGPKGSFVYVVGSDGKAAMAPVSVRQTEQDIALIGSGLSTGEAVVTQGQYKLKPGAKVAVVPSVPAEAPLSPVPQGVGD